VTNTQKGEPNPTSLDNPASEPTNEEIAEALRIMGEECACPSLMGTALFHAGELTVDCPVHGVLGHKSGIDTSKWKSVIGQQMGESVDRQFRSNYKGTFTYGQELGSKGQETEEGSLRDEGREPVGVYHTEDTE
jgi:hypothetical protein